MFCFAEKKFPYRYDLYITGQQFFIIPCNDITFVDGTVYKAKNLDTAYDALELPDYNMLKADKLNYAKSFYTQYCNTDPFIGKRMYEKYSETMYVIQNTPQKPLSQTEMDDVYALPYMRNYHPSYEELGGVPAIAEVKFSLVSNRGCFGGCNFCALTFHQGRIIQSRSKESIIEEAKLISKDPNFKGYIHDIGGPTANFYKPSCDKQTEHGVCTNKDCLGFNPCKNLKVDHSEYLDILREVRKLDGIKKVFVRSGLRYDYIMYDKNKNVPRGTLLFLSTKVN